MEAAGSASSLQPWKTLSFSETNKRKTKGKISMVLPQRTKKKFSQRRIVQPNF
uniref:Uncharacterized protein n=1 Tax=Solanum lycopersicum TaxID=4081 RepID=A0A3Q7EE76_SOLLC